MVYIISGITYIPAGDCKPNFLSSERPRQFLVKFTINQTTRQVPLAIGTADSTEQFMFDASESTRLRATIYYKRRLLGDYCVGWIEETLEKILREPDGVLLRSVEKPTWRDKVDVKGRLRFAISLSDSDVARTDPSTPSSPQPAPAFERLQDDVSLPQVAALVQEATIKSEEIPPMDPRLHRLTVLSEGVSAHEPTDPVSAAVVSLLGKIKILTEIGDSVAEIHPYVTIAWTALALVPKAINTQIERDKKIQDLVETMDTTFSFLQDEGHLVKIKSHEHVFSRMLQQTAECAFFIRDYANDPSFWKRLIKGTIMGVDSRIEEFKAKYSILNEQFQTGVLLETGLSVLRMVNIVDSIAVAIDLNDMQYAKGAGHTRKNECLPNTRLKIIDEILTWATNTQNDNPRRLFWLHGVAGSGKSSIANTIARILADQQRLGSFFAFDYARQADRRPDQLFSTIAVDLADLDAEWRKSLWTIVKDKRSLRTTSDIAEQFDKFFLETLRNASLRIVGPIVIVIDGLDECGDEGSREDLLHVLARKIQYLPSSFRIVLTSRTEKDILESLSRTPHVYSRSMADIEGDSTDHDISLFIHSQLKDVCSSQWPKNWRERLVQKSEHLFQWAFTACCFIKGRRVNAGRTPIERLDITLSTSVTTLDSLYREILTRTFHVGGVSDETALDRFKMVLGIILLSEEVWTVYSLQEFCKDALDPGVVTSILKSLGSLLTGVEEWLMPVRPLHTSFHDFLMNRDRSGYFYIEPSVANTTLTLRCLRVMQRTEDGLRFNICNLETSYAREWSYLPPRFERRIGPHLSYACRFWVHHLRQTPIKEFASLKVRKFLHEYFLYWIEVLMLCEDFLVIEPMSLLSEYADSNPITNLADFAYDASVFLDLFKPFLLTSVPHLYLSALPFTPKQSFISKSFLPSFPNTLSLNYPVQTMFHEMKAASFSSEGTHILAYSEKDDKVGMWEVATGNIVDVATPFYRGEEISAFACSPNGSHICTGFRGGTIHVWETTHTDVAPTIFDCNGPISCLAFSLDGLYIAAGRDSGTIYIWDLSSPLRPPRQFMGLSHFPEKISILFPPCNKRIVVRAEWSISIWCLDSARDMQPVWSVLLRNEDRVKVVHAISADGRYMVHSGEIIAKNLIHLWDMQSNDRWVLPESSLVNDSSRVFFRPDNAYVASITLTGELRVWHTKTCSLIKFHKTPCVFPEGFFGTFLPDCTHILLLSHYGNLEKINYMDGGKVEMSNPLYFLPVSCQDSTWEKAKKRSLGPIDCTSPPNQKRTRYNRHGFWVQENAILLEGYLAHEFRQRADFSKFVYGTDWTKCKGV